MQDSTRQYKNKTIQEHIRQYKTIPDKTRHKAQQDKTRHKTILDKKQDKITDKARQEMARQDKTRIDDLGQYK